MDNLVLGLSRMGRRRTSSLSDIEKFNEINHARPETWPELKVIITLKLPKIDLCRFMRAHNIFTLMIGVSQTTFILLNRSFDVKNAKRRASSNSESFMVLDKCMTKSDIQMVQSHFSKIQKDSDCELTQAKQFMECHFG